MRTNRLEATRRASCRSVVLVQTNVSDKVLHGGALSGVSRRTDFGEMERVLDADMIDHAVVDRDRVGRVVRRLVHYPAALAVVAFRRRRRYDVFWCLSEVDGLILALLFKFAGFHRPILMIGIEASSPKATFLLRRLGLHRYVTALLTTSTPQTDHLVAHLGLPPEKVFVLPYQVDTEFFAISHATPRRGARPYIVAAGLESRDYDSLVEAVRDLPVDVVIAAASHWAGRSARFQLDALPPNVTVTSVDYEGLRDLYAGARLVVAPLHEAEYQHGITSIQEAMAMGRALVVTRTLGQGDAVADRRRVLRAVPSRSTAGTFARLFAPDDVDLHGSTGIYVPPSAPGELRCAIRYLLEHPDVAAEMGERGRRVAENVLSLDQFLARVVRLNRAAYEGRPVSFATMLGD
jgi:glycosyltransferase involved in cell wall biosynthesis